MIDEPTVAERDANETELFKEASVMALYVAVCLLAALAAVDEDAGHGHVRAFAIIWGTTIGLAVAHAFAFRLSAQLVAHGALPRDDARAIAAQLVGAATVAVLASVPVLLVDVTAEFDIARLVLAGFITLSGYTVARQSGASTGRSLVYAGAVVVIGITIALTKNILSGH